MSMFKYRNLKRNIVSSSYDRKNDSITIEFKSEAVVKLIRLIANIKGSSVGSKLTINLKNDKNNIDVNKILDFLELVNKVEN